MNNYVDSAVNHYRALLEEQLARVDAMNNAAPAKDFTALPVVTIGVIDGDGIGPIISKQTSRVLEVLLKDELANGSIVMKHIEGLTIENRLAKGQAVPDDVLAAVKECDVLLKGPTETPKGGTMGSANVRLRQALDLYANVRPVSVPEKGIAAEDWYADIVTAKLVDERVRGRFQVFVLPNLYGDIITDEAAQIQGGVGTAGSANLGDQYAMFEAIHGSAPRMIETGRGDYANPSSLLRAASMMLRHIARYDKAATLDKALDTVPHDGDTAQGFADRLIAAIEG